MHDTDWDGCSSQASRNDVQPYQGFVPDFIIGRGRGDMYNVCTYLFMILGGGREGEA